MQYRLLLPALALASTALISPASAAILVNGSFEQGVNDASDGGPGIANGGFTTKGTGNTDITGWTVQSGSIDWINDYWEAYEGTHSVDLSGDAPGSIEQTFATTAGIFYTVTYYLSGNPDGGDIAKQGVIAAINGGIIASDTILGIKAPSRGDMQYLENIFTFTATGPTTTLRFTSNSTEGAFGAALDMVSISPVPEPAAWAMMIGGFGLVGGAMRRRRKVAVSFA